MDTCVLGWSVLLLWFLEYFHSGHNPSIHIRIPLFWLSPDSGEYKQTLVFPRWLNKRRRRIRWWYLVVVVGCGWWLVGEVSGKMMMMMLYDEINLTAPTTKEAAAGAGGGWEENDNTSCKVYLVLVSSTFIWLWESTLRKRRKLVLHSLSANLPSHHFPAYNYEQIITTQSFAK